MSAPSISRRTECGSDREWRQRAACRAVDPDLFFPSTESGPVYDRQVGAAKAVCARCPVRAECLAEALVRLPYGIAGGLTEHERRRLAQRPGRSRRADGGVAVEEVARVGTRAEVAAAGRVLLGRGRPAREVARRCGVTERTAQRWAATGHSVWVLASAVLVLGLLSLRGGSVCSCECMTCALGQHCGACRTGDLCPSGGGSR